MAYKEINEKIESTPGLSSSSSRNNLKRPSTPTRGKVLLETEDLNVPKSRSKTPSKYSTRELQALEEREGNFSYRSEAKPVRLGQYRELTRFTELGDRQSTAILSSYDRDILNLQREQATQRSRSKKSAKQLDDHRASVGMQVDNDDL